MAEVNRFPYRIEQRGFTILEIVVVVALMGLIAAIAGPRIGSGLKGTENRTSIRKFAAALRAARMTAVSRKARVLVVAELDGNTCEFRFQPAGRRGHSAGTRVNDGSGSGQISGSGSAIPEIFQSPLELTGDVRFTGFRTPDSSTDAERAAIMFLPHGNSTGGTFFIGSENGPSHQVSIDPVTGRVHTVWTE